VIALDTNILVRWILQDDLEQAKIAENLLSEPCWVGATVVLELGWVLLKPARLSRASVFRAISILFDIPTVHFERGTDLKWALERFEHGGDLGDMLHLATTAKVDRFVTFDKKLAAKAGPNSPVPIDTLGI
jgi:predicted nucleic-acid-binding protein